MLKETFFKMIIIFVGVINSLGQRVSYGGPCNSTEECSDHRYECLPAEEDTLRCLCDRFHSWMGDNVGCVQMYNASEIMNMTVTVTDNIKNLEEQVEAIIKIQIAAGLFVFGMVITASIIVTIFCVYVHIKDRDVSKKVPCKKKKEDQSVFLEFPPSTSISNV